MAERGVLKRAMRLRPADEAKTVRVRGGEVIVTDGPFTESKEWIAGYDLLEVADLAEAEAIAKDDQLARFAHSSSARSGRSESRHDVEFMLFIATDPEAEPMRSPTGSRSRSGATEMTRRGVSIAGDRLRPPEDARTVRVRGDDAIVTDGPFTESKEWIAGYDVIECADLDEAIEIASKHPMARAGAHRGAASVAPRRARRVGSPRAHSASDAAGQAPAASGSRDVDWNPSTADRCRSGRSSTMGVDDRMENTAEDLKGKAKEAAGKMTDDERLEAEGKIGSGQGRPEERRGRRQGRLQALTKRCGITAAG